MTSSRTGRRRGRPPVHPPEAIAQLLAERDRTGESFASLSRRSGIPAGTLSNHACRRHPKTPPLPAFVELHPVVAPSEDARAAGCDVCIELDTDGRPRAVRLSGEFSVAALPQVFSALETRC
ncbi:MAG TPA: hypothetical protein DIS91_05980 [Microbacterium sp.]|nr:hypothetical protein [Microbacterium sp.]